MHQKSYTEFDVIYKEFYRRAFLFTKSYVHNELIAEDIVSEALIKLWEQIKIQDIANPAAFLLTLLRNKSLDVLRHESIKGRALDEIKNAHDEELNLRISLLESCDPEELFTTEIKQILTETLSRQSELTQSIFKMSRFENKSNKEIADITGLTVKSVEYHITKLLKILKVSLKDYLPFLMFMWVNLKI